MTAQPAPVPQWRNVDNTGAALVNGLLYTYAAGTTTPQASYTDSTQGTPNTNPVQLNARGEASVWLDPTLMYKLVITDQFGNTLWTQDQVPGGYVPTAQIAAQIPPVLATITNQPILASYARTAAEIAASVTPTNYAYPVLTLERYGGGTSASASANNTALSAALAVATSAGGGVVISLGTGTYTFSASFVIPPYTAIQGQGYGTILKYTGSGSFLTMNSTSSRARLLYLQVIGTSQTGTGLTLGDSSGNAGFVTLDHVLFSGWNVAMRLGGATWLRCNKCEFGNAAGINAGTIVTTNNIGVDFNFFNTGNYSSALSFIDCVVSNNATQGVKGTNVPVFMNNVVWINCTVQNNCQGTPANPQFELSQVAGFTIDNIYMEYLGSGTVPDAIKADNFNYGTIRSPFIAQCTNGIVDRTSGLVSKVEILGAQINASSAAINLQGEHDVIVRGGTFTGTVTVGIIGCTYLPAGSGLASWPINENGFTPAIAFGTSGSITQSVQAATYSQVGNVVTFSFRINWSAISAPTGSVTITGFPVAAKSGGPDVAIAVGYASGLTIAAGSLSIFLANGTTTATVYNVQTTTAALQGSAFASSGTIIVSGSYQV